MSKTKKETKGRTATKSYEEIRAKIANGDVVVMAAEEFKQYVKTNGVAKAAKEVDVVTTGTFGAMCSSGAYFNFGHSDPPIKMQRVWLDGIPAYTGLAAVDAYIGATELDESNNMLHGGAHVIEDFVRGKAVRLRATAYGTDCYPRKEIDTYVSLKTVNQSVLFNTRNCYQNYACATNSSSRTLYTYMGKLLPEFGNASLAQALGLPADAVNRLCAAALLHDIGKIGVRDSILPKTGALTTEEFEEVKTHPRLAVAIISNVPSLAPCVPAILYHHERFAGTGYPQGLKGEDIPLEARILAVPDCLADMTADRPYRPALDWKEAMAEITRHSGSQFDPSIAKVFVALMESGAISKPSKPASSLSCTAWPTGPRCLVPRA